MSRLALSLLLSLFLLSSSDLLAEGGAQAISSNGRPTCYGWVYPQKLAELDTNYRLCLEQYTAEALSNPNFRSSPAGCGNPSAFPARAEQLARAQCPDIPADTPGLNPVIPAEPPGTNRVLAIGAEECDPVINPACLEVPVEQPGEVVVQEAPQPLPPLDRSRVVTDPTPAPGPGPGTSTPPRPPVTRADPDPRPIPDDPDRQTPPTPDPRARRENPPVNQQPAAVNPDTGAAQYEAQNDINACAASQSMASRCCGNPQACTGTLSTSDRNRLNQLMQGLNQAPAAGQGLTDYCNQMRATTTSGSGINQLLSSVCSTQKVSCESSCGGLIAKYQSLMASCGNCSAAYTYSQAYNTLMSYRSACSALASRASQIAMQGSANAYSGAHADACSDMAAVPQGLDLTPAEKAAKAQAAASTAGDCTRNPNQAGCQKLNTAGAVDPNGAAGFGQSEKQKNAYNLPDMGDMGNNGFVKGGVQPQSVSNRTIPNNSGGGIPGGGTNPATLGPNTRGSPGSPGYDTDVFQGNMSGGYSQPVGQNSGGFDEDGRPRRGGGDGNDPNNPMLGMDLKKFLPGGDMDPNRKVAGIGRGSQINPKEENIWRIISNKMEEKCRLGVLWRCGPEFDHKK